MPLSKETEDIKSLSNLFLKIHCLLKIYLLKKNMRTLIRDKFSASNHLLISFEIRKKKDKIIDSEN